MATSENTTTQFTPGPWKFTHNHGSNHMEIETVADEPGTYRHLTNNLPMWGDRAARAECGCDREALASAYLMAAAPALYVALQTILADCQAAQGRRTTADWDFATSLSVEYAREALALADNAEVN